MKEKVLLAFMLAVLTGCTAKLTNDVVELLPFRMVYTATIENPDTKVFVDGNLKTHWNEGDEISIFTTTYNQHFKFDGQTGDDDGSFTMQGDSQSGKEIPATYAVYPYDESTSISTKGVLSLYFPSVQNYAENSYGLGANTMVAVTESSESNTLRFKNLCGYVVVRLYGEGTVKTINLTGNNDERIAGKASVKALYEQEPVVSMSSSTTKTITLDCGEGVELGKTADTATAFWFAVPPITFSKGFTICVTSTNLSSMEKATLKDRTVTRNIKNQLSPIEVSFNIPFEGNIEFADANFKAYCVENFDMNLDREISYSEAAKVNTIECEGAHIQSLDGIQYFTNLEFLYCSNNDLTSLDVSNKTKLYSLRCKNNHLTTINLSNCVNLSNLNVENNLLSSIDVRDCPVLWQLSCLRNQIVSLDVSQNLNLYSLLCGFNQLTSLDISNNVLLHTLDCESNSISLLTLGHGNVHYLWCHDNNLDNLDVSGYPGLYDLNCGYNKLKVLDVSNNPKLVYLYCQKTQLSSLDVSNNSNLAHLRCSSNPYLAEIWLKRGQTISEFSYDYNVATIKYKD